MISLNNLIVKKLMSLRFFYPYKNVHDESVIVTGEWLLRSQKQYVLKICIPELVVVAAIFFI